jgi:hypothetical protein
MGCGCGGRRNVSARPQQTAIVPNATRQAQIQASQRRVEAQAAPKAQAQPNVQLSAQAAPIFSNDRNEIERKRRIQVSLRNRNRRPNNPRD